MNRREFFETVGYSLGALAVTGRAAGQLPAAGRREPNIVYILADDLGYGDLGCYGQEKIQTPHIDRLAAEGMKFTQHYSGNPVCAPSRCTLMTGLHTGHAQIRNNKQVGGQDAWQLGATTGGQWPLAEGTVTVANLLQQAGYVTGAFGKWGLGRVGTSGEPARQGIDYFFGYICQRQAHTYYPNHLWRNNEVVKIPENENGQEKVYSQDLIIEEALQFVRRHHKDRPFFLYLPFTIPHVALQVPPESLAPYRGRWPDPAYDGKRGYVPHEHPRACYAGMISRLDGDVGRVMSLLKELNLDEDTLVIFTSDNGPTTAGGVDPEFFQSAGPLRGLKGSVYEGGIRVPLIARWPGRIEAGSTSDHVSAFWDFLPTCCDLLDRQPPPDIDGVSYLPTLRGQPDRQKRHDYLYWELNGRQGVRRGNWKAVRNKPDQKIELYNLAADIAESQDLAGQRPEIVAQMTEILKNGRTESEVFPLQKKT
ncbi:MAG: arylsulfatase [Sedimentisphaerales bacterium]|nr:arylsulfatase [Sedimentisphaerales bacterium]